MKTSQPVGPGWYKFKGRRYTASRRYMVTVDDLVKVIAGRRVGTYRVQMAGKADEFSTEMYEGEWEKVEL